MVTEIPESFVRYYKSKSGVLRRDPQGPQMKMSLQECWHKWQPYWPQRQNGDWHNKDHGSSYVLGRYGDHGDYTVENCRVITHRENTMERDHKKCSKKLTGRVSNPQGISGPLRKIMTPRGQFDNCAEAARAYGMHRSSMWHRVQSELWSDFYWMVE